MAEHKDLPQTFKKLHFLKLEQKSSGDENSDICHYTLKNHFDKEICKIERKRIEPGNNKDLATDLFTVTEQPKTSKKKAVKNAEKSDKIDEKNEKDIFSLRITELHDNPGLSCKLLSSLGKILSYIKAVKDKPSYSYDLLDTNGIKSSLFEIKRANGEKILLINSIPTEGKETSTIARITVVQNKIFLAMTPELNSLTKFRLIAIMLLMEMVEDKPSGEEIGASD